MKPSIDVWVKEVRENADPDNLGMVLIHNGVVRATSKTGRRVYGMDVFCDEEKLKEVVSEAKSCEGIEEVRVWVNSGRLRPGDDIMLVLVAGRYRRDVFPVFDRLIDRLKKEVLGELEVDLNF